MQTTFEQIKSLFIKILPWAITFIALYYAFRGIDWNSLFEHLRSARINWILLALMCTCASYLMRARRWQFLFPEMIINFSNSLRVLLLGFYMNNILPARTGELIRAHLGAKITGETRTLILATVATERLVDGLTISLMFVGFSLGMGSEAKHLLYVSLFFAGSAILVVLLLAQRARVFTLVDRLNQKFNNKASHYTLTRLQIFIHGLSPLVSRSKLPLIALWSAIVWTIELGVYFAVAKAFDSNLSLSYCVLFLVTVNFSSLIPAAPGGIGVIEAVTTLVLSSVGVEREHALTMVLTQHALQYLVVGIPGTVLMLTWKKTLPALESN